MSKKRFKAEQIVVLLRQIDGKPEYRSRAIIAGGRYTVVLSLMRPSE